MNSPAQPTTSRVTAVSDGRAGNQRQAVALAAAMAGGDVPHVQVDASAPWRWLAPRRLPGALTAMGEGIAALSRSPGGIIVGCGRQAALATRVLRSNATKAVQILDPRIDPSHWDVVVVPEHDALRGDNVVTLLGSLHPVDDAWLADVRARSPRAAQWQGDVTAVLLGGPTAAVPMQRDDISARLRELAASVHAAGGTLLATTSRRTPREWLPALREALGPDASLWTGTEDGDNPYAAMLAHAQRIVCTPDSVNMLSEACATHALVEVLPVASSGRVGSFIQALRERRRIRDVGSDITIDCTPLRETIRVANEIRRRLGLSG